MTALPPLDVLTIGEALIDFISAEPADSLRDVSTFRRHQGGSPANLAVNVAKLGGRSAIVAKTGVGAFGQFLKAELEHHGVSTEYLVMDNRVHTSLVFVAQTSGTPDFEPYRNGDFKLTPEELPGEAIERAAIVHGTTWPLSREPSRSTLIGAFKAARAQGKVVSFDPNYSPVIWPNRDDARQAMREAYQYITITKASLDDSQRFFGPGHQPLEYVQMFHELGPKTVVFTMGRQGSLVSFDGKLLGRLPPRPIEVVDATGAGDAFWAGFLTALADGHSLERCLLFAREVVELKLRTIGPLPGSVSRADLYARLPDPQEALRFDF